MPRRPSDSPAETLEARRVREAQTARNVAGLEAEQEGRIEDAIALYERNAADGFAGDWPYGRLVAIYERRRAFDEAERVILRAIAVLEASSTRLPRDRRALVRTFRKRLALVRQQRRTAGRPS